MFFLVKTQIMRTPKLCGKGAKLCIMNESRDMIPNVKKNTFLQNYIFSKKKFDQCYKTGSSFTCVKATKM